MAFVCCKFTFILIKTKIFNLTKMDTISNKILTGMGVMLLIIAVPLIAMEFINPQPAAASFAESLQNWEVEYTEQKQAEKAQEEAYIAEKEKTCRKEKEGATIKVKAFAAGELTLSDEDLLKLKWKRDDMDCKDFQ